MNIALLKKLSEAPGVPGREERVRDILQKELRTLNDQISIDPMGSLIGTIAPSTKNQKSKGKTKKLLLACHIDEIGFYVRHVSDNGFIHITAVGGFDTKNLAARRVMIQSS